MAPIAPVTFQAGATGQWRIDRIAPATGPSLPAAPRLNVAFDLAFGPDRSNGVAWSLRGTAGHQRYVERREQEQLRAVQAPLGRPSATRAALIPIRKSDEWWELAQDERRRIFEQVSHHISGSLKYLPAVARRLYHSRDLREPFDFLTWFEYGPEHVALFEDLVGMLRSTEEWKYVVREVDIRLSC